MIAFFLIMLSGLAVLGVWCAAAAWGRWRFRHVMVAGVSGIWLVFVVLSVVGAALPDAIDDLPKRHRGIAANATGGGLGCGIDWPLPRITEVAVSDDGDRVEWRCAWTLLGWPSVSSSAHCVEGEWAGPGYRDLSWYGSCGSKSSG